MPNFAEAAANTKFDDVERPPLLPHGTYRWIVEKIPTQESSPDGKWDFVDFPLKVMAPMDDVDQDLLAEYGSLANARMRHRFIFDKADQQAFDRTLYNMKRFVGDTLKVDLKGKSIKEVLPECVNQTLLASIVYKADRNDPQIQHANIGKTAPDV